MAMTDGFGVDVAIEAVGVPATFDACTKIVRPGGSVANVGVHGAPVELALQDLWIMDLSITTGLVSTNTTPMLLKLVAQDRLAAASFATHHFTLAQMLEAYDTFGRAAETKALKVVIKR
jgi:alcohol dehydrogenase